jgi:hypothetical protein
MKTALLAAKDRLIAIALIMLGGMIFFLRSMQSARNKGREEVEDEFQSNDTRQAEEIREAVKDADLEANDDDDRSAILDRLRKQDHLRTGDDSDRDG